MHVTGLWGLENTMEFQGGKCLSEGLGCREQLHDRVGHTRLHDHSGPYMRDDCISEDGLLNPTSGHGHRLEPGQEGAPAEDSEMDCGSIGTLGAPSGGCTPHAFGRGLPRLPALPSDSRKAAFRSKPYGFSTK